VANSFAYGSRELVVAPGSRARFRVRRKLGRYHHSREIALRKYLTGSELCFDRRTAQRFPVMFRMAMNASRDSVGQVTRTR
jgi:hypothetical protein